jgi:hypothetical protein
MCKYANVLMKSQYAKKNCDQVAAVVTILGIFKIIFYVFLLL